MPGKWVHSHSIRLWDRYVYLVGVEKENERLSNRIQELSLELIKYREEQAQNQRLRQMLSFTPPEDWKYAGARVIGQRMGPNSSLATVLLDKGTSDKVHIDTPVLTLDAVLGRVFRVSQHFSSVLLLTDPNSKVAVLSSKHRTPGILVGTGADETLRVQYVSLNDLLEEGDILITSGLAGVFPKGLPVARVTKIVRSNLSLFQEVWAEPLVNMKHFEEVFVLMEERSPWKELDLQTYFAPD